LIRFLPANLGHPAGEAGAELRLLTDDLSIDMRRDARKKTAAWLRRITETLSRAVYAME